MNDMSGKPQIGKDVIESLTLGMYEDCRFIYREYIQNAADAIDKAVSEGLIEKAITRLWLLLMQKNTVLLLKTMVPAYREGMSQTFFST